MRPAVTPEACRFIAAYLRCDGRAGRGPGLVAPGWHMCIVVVRQQIGPRDRHHPRTAAARDRAAPYPGTSSEASP